MRFDPGLIHVGFVVDRVALGQDFIRVFLFYPDSIIAPMLPSHLHVNTALVRRTSGRSLGTLKQSNALSGQEGTFTFYFRLQWDKA
jgi:hypothetical protein